MDISRTHTHTHSGLDTQLPLPAPTELTQTFNWYTSNMYTHDTTTASHTGTQTHLRHTSTQHTFQSTHFVRLTGSLWPMNAFREWIQGLWLHFSQVVHAWGSPRPMTTPELLYQRSSEGSREGLDWAWSCTRIADPTFMFSGWLWRGTNGVTGRLATPTPGTPPITLPHPVRKAVVVF